eukprot:CAMPEP_0119270956 /NCGR_PEP_ID=MMETSP1329-20130426/7749_1 /TAXON_ID=114041 /ORGANISM="Genus nov. species nov., Strain RCC1024" /LENGTH=284 /DNA_ID=CAMNT_0007270993 /DNA_START=121 /DNA_END=971 /DNA_ORIENTATION=-
MACHRGLAIITGGAGGLGLALAHRFLKTGGRRVRLLDKVAASAGQSAAAALAAAHGGEAEFVACDVTDGEALKAGFADAGDLGLVVNNAGIAGRSTEDPFEAWEAMIGINLTAVVQGTKLAMEAFEAQRSPDALLKAWGDQAADGFSGDRVVINIGSMAGLVPTAGMPVYSATKFGVVGFSRAMHAVAKRRGFRVHALCPSFLETGMVNPGTLEADPRAAKLVDVFGGLMDKERVVDACFEKLVDDPAAKAVLRMTPYEGAAYDEPGLHPAERAIRNELIKKDP